MPSHTPAKRMANASKNTMKKRMLLRDKKTLKMADKTKKRIQGLGK